MHSSPCTPPKKPMAGALGSLDPIAAVTTETPACRFALRTPSPLEPGAARRQDVFEFVELGEAVCSNA